MASNRRIWVALVDGKGAQLTSPAKVNISPDNDVDDVKQAVKVKFHNLLERIAPTDLSVYADQAAFACNDAPLAAYARVEGYGEHWANPILVVAPSTSNKRQREDDVETPGAVESPVSVFSNKAWREFVSTVKPKLSGKHPLDLLHIEPNMIDSNFFHALCTAPINPVDRIEDLPIAEPVEDCITTFTDPITKVQVVCLPHRLPQSALIFNHVVFIRPFTVAMVNAMTACKKPRIVLVGNSGIGKSYMQLVILLWWARPELRPVLENVDDGAALDKFLDGIQAIARVERDSWTDLFFKREQLHYGVETLPLPSLSGLDSPSNLLLYEPCVSKDEIQFSGITRGHVWATVSPLKDRYKEFSKTRAAVKYMECPYEDELVFMAAVMVNGVEPELKPLYEASLVRERIRTRGPFLRVVLPESADDLNADDMAEGSELAELTLKKLQKAWFITEERIVGMMKISDRILRISPVLDGVFQSYTLKPANDRVVETLGNLMFDVDVRELKRQLIAYIANPDDRWVSPAVKESMPITLETFFVKYAAAHDIERRWEGWEVATAKFSANPNDDPNWVPQWEAFSLNVNHINRAKKPTYADFVAAPMSIFHMNDPGYPFVDCFWYDADMKAVHAGQVTMSQNGHPKGVGTFNTMKKNIGIPDGVKLVVNYITLPLQADGYANGPRSYFFSNVDDGGVTAIQQTVEFRVIKMSLS